MLAFTMGVSFCFIKIPSTEAVIRVKAMEKKAKLVPKGLSRERKLITLGMH